MFSLRVKLLGGAIALSCVALLVVGYLLAVGAWRSDSADAADTAYPTPAAGEPTAADAAASQSTGADAGTAEGDGVTTGRPPIGAKAIDSAWLNRQAAVTGVPGRVLLAYVSGANWANRKWSACNLDWSTLAGIGYVETHHGTIAGSQVGADGVARPKIVGVRLDGAKTARIADTDGGKYDGDSRYDRAVGPMQFIPRSWAKYGVDGNQDGKRNPQQIDDAVFTAGRYLCAAGANLSARAAWQQAILSFNNSWDYVQRVSGAATTIATNSCAAG